MSFQDRINSFRAGLESQQDHFNAVADQAAQVGRSILPDKLADHYAMIEKAGGATLGTSMLLAGMKKKYKNYKNSRARKAQEAQGDTTEPNQAPKNAPKPSTAQDTDQSLSKVKSTPAREDAAGDAVQDTAAEGLRAEGSILNPGADARATGGSIKTVDQGGKAPGKAPAKSSATDDTATAPDAAGDAADLKPGSVLQTIRDRIAARQGSDFPARPLAPGEAKELITGQTRAERAAARQGTRRFRYKEPNVDSSGRPRPAPAQAAEDIQPVSSAAADDAATLATRASTAVRVARQATVAGEGLPGAADSTLARVFSSGRGTQPTRSLAKNIQTDVGDEGDPLLSRLGSMAKVAPGDLGRLPGVTEEGASFLSRAGAAVGQVGQKVGEFTDAIAQGGRAAVTGVAKAVGGEAAEAAAGAAIDAATSAVPIVGEIAGVATLIAGIVKDVRHKHEEDKNPNQPETAPTLEATEQAGGFDTKAVFQQSSGPGII